MRVLGKHLLHPCAIGHIEHILQPVGGGLVRADDAEVACSLVGLHDSPQETTHHPRGFRLRLARLPDLDGMRCEFGHDQRLAQDSSVRMRVVAYTPCSGRRRGQYFGDRTAVFLKKFLWPVALEPFLEQLQVVGVCRETCERHLV